MITESNELTTLNRRIADHGSGNFFCMDGVPMAYMEFPFFDATDQLTLIRFQYRTFRFGYQRADVKVEEDLCNQFFRAMMVLKENYYNRVGKESVPIMFWRLRPYIDCQRPPHGREGSEITMIRARLCIPGLKDEDYQIPEFALEGGLLHVFPG